MQINSPQDTLELLKGYRFKKQEHFGIICLDSGFNVLSKKVLFKGGSSSSLVDTKVLFWEVCKKNSCAIIVFHNHPSGNVRPSEEDIPTTKTIEKSCKILGISFLDHVIVGKHRHYSFKEHDLIGNEAEVKAVAERD